MGTLQKEEAAKIHFLFTEDGFLPDGGEQIRREELRPWRELFDKTPYRALYDLGFQEKPDWLDAAGQYLYQLADCFLQILTHQPDIELLRENVVITPDGDTIRRLLNAVPFTLGSEYVTEKWILGIFGQLQKIYVEEIGRYEGTVALYLADKSQHLRVPERIFSI